MSQLVGTFDHKLCGASRQARVRRARMRRATRQLFISITIPSETYTQSKYSLRLSRNAIKGWNHSTFDIQHSPFAIRHLAFMYHENKRQKYWSYCSASMTSLSARDDNFDSKTCYRQLNKIMNDSTDFKRLFRISAPAHIHIQMLKWNVLYVSSHQ